MRVIAAPMWAMSSERDRFIRRRAKVMMRRRFRSHRKALPAGSVRERSAALCKRLLQLPEVSGATDIAAFWPMIQRREIDLRPAHRALHERGCNLYYPRIPEDGGPLLFHVLENEEALVDGPFGTHEPPENAPQPDLLDVVIVPGLAYDPRGYRIGYGGGFYDRTLPQWCPPALAIGVCFDFQLAAEVPIEPFDVSVDIIVTDRRVLRVQEETPAEQD